MLKQISSGAIPPGTAWINGLLDDAEKAKKIVVRAEKRNAKKRKR